MEELIKEAKENLILPENSFIILNLLFIGNNNIEVLLKSYIFPLKDYYLMFFEQQKLTYNELILKMSQINDQILNMTRELKKRIPSSKRQLTK